jgi:hypothetical protein
MFLLILLKQRKTIFRYMTEGLYEYLTIFYVIKEGDILLMLFQEIVRKLLLRHVLRILFSRHFQEHPKIENYNFSFFYYLN